MCRACKHQLVSEWYCAIKTHGGESQNYHEPHTTGYRHVHINQWGKLQLSNIPNIVLSTIMNFCESSYTITY